MKFLRKKSGKTQDALSTDLKIGRTTIANYEAGISEPNLETLLTFANYFGATVDEMLSTNMEEQGKKLKSTILLPTTDSKKATEPLPYSKIPQVITVDREGNDNIIYVPVKARAGYVLGYGDPEFMDHHLFPLVPSPAFGARVIKFGKEQFLQYNLRRAPGGKKARVQLGYADEPIALVQDALEGKVPREFLRDAAE